MKKSSNYEYRDDFYVIKVEKKSGGSVFYQIKDKYYHFCWGTSESLEDAYLRSIKFAEKMPSHEAITYSLHILAENDPTGYTRGFIDRFQDEEGYRDSWKSRNKAGEPPKSGDWISKQLETKGKVEFATNIYTFADLTKVGKKVKRIILKRAIERAKKERIERVTRAIRDRKRKRELKEAKKIARSSKHYDKYGTLAVFIERGKRR